MNFNAEEYWRDKPIKTWVICLARYKGRRLLDTDTQIVSTSTERRARAAAIGNSFIKPTQISSCKLATPHDLGCIPSDACVWCQGSGKNYHFKLLQEVECDRCRGTGKRVAA